jgi:hypothetical protein
VPSLEGGEGAARYWPRNPVDRTWVESSRMERNLKRGDASAGREPVRGEHENADGHSDADDDEATHVHTFAAAPVRPSGKGTRNPRLQSRRCLPR